MCIPITVRWVVTKTELFFFYLQETKNMALALSHQPTLRLVLPEKRCQKRFTEVGAVSVTVCGSNSLSGMECGEAMIGTRLELC